MGYYLEEKRILMLLNYQRILIFLGFFVNKLN
jgi:hypothetical protein